MVSQILTNNQIKRINDASLSILENTGVIIPHAEILKRFADAGAKVDFVNNRVRIPAVLVEKSLSSCTKTYTLYGRDKNKTAAFGLGKQNFNSIAGEASWVDEIGEPRRYAALEDAAIAAIMGDALENIDIVGAMSDPKEIPISYRCVEVFDTMLRNTTKPITLWFHDMASAKYLCDMMVALRGSEKAAEEMPITYPFLEPISPLRFPFDGIDLLFETARLNLPVPIGPMAQVGLSAPATLAATMAVENAEILAGVCITQLIKPGMPVCYGGICHAFDMRTTQMIFGGPEQAIFGVAMTQMGKSYGLPVYVNVGLTDSKRPDAQAGLECGVTLAMAAAAGADIFGHLGICGVDQAASLDILVMQNEVISYIKSMQRNLEISDETLGLLEIERAGPGGTFIDSDFTAEHFRKELWFPRLLNRDYYEPWLNAGAISMETKCKARKDEILRTHKPEPLPEDINRELKRILKVAKVDLCEN